MVEAGCNFVDFDARVIVNLHDLRLTGVDRGRVRIRSLTHSPWYLSIHFGKYFCEFLVPLRPFSACMWVTQLVGLEETT